MSFLRDDLCCFYYFRSDGDETRFEVPDAMSKSDMTATVTVGLPASSEDTQSKQDMSLAESRQTKELEKKESEPDESQIKEEGKLTE